MFFLQKRGAGMKKRSVCVYLVILVGTILLNVAAWNSRAFSDWYMINILPIWVNSYGWFMGLFSFSVGEFMLVAGVIIVIVAILLGLVRLGLFVFRKRSTGFNIFFRRYFRLSLAALHSGQL